MTTRGDSARRSSVDVLRCEAISRGSSSARTSRESRSALVGSRSEESTSPRSWCANNSTCCSTRTGATTNGQPSTVGGRSPVWRGNSRERTVRAQPRASTFVEAFSGFSARDARNVRCRFTARDSTRCERGSKTRERDVMNVDSPPRGAVLQSSRTADSARVTCAGSSTTASRAGTSIPTPCATRTPRTCSKGERICASSRNC